MLCGLWRTEGGKRGILRAAGSSDAADGKPAMADILTAELKFFLVCSIKGNQLFLTIYCVYQGAKRPFHPNGAFSQVGDLGRTDDSGAVL